VAGFTVLVPALPEVVTEGDNEKEALANAEEAIRAILAYRGITASPTSPFQGPFRGRCTERVPSVLLVDVERAGMQF
jgi:hypothetical protein